jgi:hypothetical protein
VRHLTASASLVAVLLASVACGDDDASSNGGSPTGTEECAASPEVTVTDAGSTPRRAMELAPTAGDSIALDLRLAMDIEARVDGQTAPTQPVPPMHLGMRMTVEDVQEDEITMSFVYDDARVEGGDPSMQSVLSSIVDSSGTLVTTRNGVFVDGEFEPAAGIDPSMAGTTEQLEQQMADLTIPLPSEPVGPDATWTVSNSLELNGIAFCNSYTYRLVEFDGDSYELETEFEQRPVGGTTETAGATVEVVDGVGHGTGSYSGSLSLPIAVTGSAEASSEMEMAVEQGGAESTQEVDTTVDIQLTRRA